MQKLKMRTKTPSQNEGNQIKDHPWAGGGHHPLATRVVAPPPLAGEPPQTLWGGPLATPSRFEAAHKPPRGWSDSENRTQGWSGLRFVVGQ